MSHQFVAGRVVDRDLTVDDRDERVPAIADPVQHIAHAGRALLAQLGQDRELRGRKRGTR